MTRSPGRPLKSLRLVQQSPTLPSEQPPALEQAIADLNAMAAALNTQVARVAAEAARIDERARDERGRIEERLRAEQEAREQIPFVTVDWVARQLSISKRHTNRLIEEGYLTAIRVGTRRHAIARSSYEAFVARRLGEEQAG